MRLTKEKFHDFMDYLFKSQPALFMAFYDHISLETPDEEGVANVLIEHPTGVSEEDYKRLLDLTKFWK